MKQPGQRLGWIVLLALLCIGVWAVPARAVDGVKLIDHAKALAGGVTPGDAPGYPVTISQPGSYRLSSNLTVPDADTTAIEISANHVTIDINGFAILGPVTCTGFPVSSCAPTGFGYGITTIGVLANIAVHNGTVRGMGFIGIFLDGGGHLVEKVRAASNGATGIVASGTVSHNAATSNSGHGINATVGTSTINHNTAASNGGFGLALVGPALGSHAGYTGNVMNGNTAGAVSGGVSLGGGNHNLCNGAPC